MNLSFSAAQRFLLSPYSWYAHYVLRLREEKLSSALIFGSSMDLALNCLLLTSDIAKAKLAFDEDWAKHKSADVKYSKADSDGDGSAWENLKEKGHIILEEYNEQVMPLFSKIVAVQIPTDVTNEFGDTFVGFADIVVTLKEDGKNYLADNKTSSVTYKPDSVRESAQLATYFDILKKQYNLHAAMYIVIPKKLRKVKKPRIQISIIKDFISEELVEKTFDQYDVVLTELRAGQFPCNFEACNSTPWGCCYRNWCKSGHTDMTGLKFVPERKK
jgi:hypothetical protein